MASAKDIVSSIFRKYVDEDLSPEFIRDEANEVCDVLEIPRIGDPGRTAREFAERGFVTKYNGTCKYSPNSISQSLKTEFESYEYVYAYADFDNRLKKHGQKKFDDLLVQLKKIIDNNPELGKEVESLLKDDSIEDRKIDFTLWLSQNCKGKSDFRKHMVMVVEKWLDQKIPNAQIGNLFRFENSSDYEIEKNILVSGKKILPKIKMADSSNEEPARFVITL